MRLYRRKPFIPIFERNARVVGQSLRKFMDICRLPSSIAAHMKWIPHQKKRYLVLQNDVCNIRQICPDIDPLERRKPLCRYA